MMFAEKDCVGTGEGSKDVTEGGPEHTENVLDMHFSVQNVEHKLVPICPNFWDTPVFRSTVSPMILENVCTKNFVSGNSDKEQTDCHNNYYYEKGVLYVILLEWQYNF